MRRLLLPVISAFLLIAATILCWNRAHQPLNGGPAVSIPDGGPWIDVCPGATKIDLPGLGTAEGLHLRYDLEADEIRQGPEDWQTGRMHLEWVRDGAVIDRRFLASAWDHHTVSESSTIVRDIPPRATARLHIENLGLSGRCRLVQFEAFPTRKSDLPRLGMLIAALGWLAWAAWVAGGLRRPRSWLAAILWVGCAYFLVVPGPWPTRSPLLGEFAMSSVDTFPVKLATSSFEAADCRPGITETPNLLLRWKIRLRPLRPLLHGLLFFVPALGFLAFADTHARALGLVASLAVLVEVAQWGFGYGFEASDLLDLATDACGIALAVWAFRRWKRRRPPAGQTKTGGWNRSL